MSVFYTFWYITLPKSTYIWAFSYFNNTLRYRYKLRYMLRYFYKLDYRYIPRYRFMLRYRYRLRYILGHSDMLLCSLEYPMKPILPPAITNQRCHTKPPPLIILSHSTNTQLYNPGLRLQLASHLGATRMRAAISGPTPVFNLSITHRPCTGRSAASVVLSSCNLLHRHCSNCVPSRAPALINSSGEGVVCPYVKLHFIRTGSS